MKFLNFNEQELVIEKSEFKQITGGTGTSTTSYKEVGATVTENEYHDANGDGELSDEELKGPVSTVELEF
jgi:hypothetical protein